MLKEKINADLISAMKSKDEVKVSVLRLLKAAIMKFEVSGDKKQEASDDAVLQLINKEVKQRKDSVEAFKKGAREDLATKEEAEMKVLQEYLPEQMSEDELRVIVKTVIAETGATSKGEFGKVMGSVMQKVKGKADGEMVKRIVTELLK